MGTITQNHRYNSRPAFIFGISHCLRKKATLSRLKKLTTHERYLESKYECGGNDIQQSLIMTFAEPFRVFTDRRTKKKKWQYNQQPPVVTIFSRTHHLPLQFFTIGSTHPSSLDAQHLAQGLFLMHS